MRADGPLKLAIIIPAYRPVVGYGGPIRSMGVLAESLVLMGHSVTVHTSDLGDGGTRISERDEVIDGVRVRRYRTPWRYGWAGVSPEWLLRADKALRDADLVHISGVRDGFGPVAAATARRLKRPVIWEPKGMLRAAGRSRLKKVLVDGMLVRRQVRRAAALMVTSAIERAEVVRAGIDPDLIRLRPNPLRVPEHPSSAAITAMRIRIGAHGSDDSSDSAWPVVGYLGRINYRKGLTTVAKALRILFDSGLQARFALAGQVEDPDVLAAIHEELGPYSDRVVSLGSLSGADPWAFQAACDLTVLASAFGENFGNAPAESMAMGTPVVVSNACGVAEWVTAESGRVLAPDAPQLWSDILGEILRGERVFDPVAVRAAVEPLKAMAIAKRQVAIYREVLRGVA